MTVREILKMGDPRLLRIAQPVAAFDTDELHLLVRDMFETMHAVNGAGLAAPQIGVDQQLVIFGTDTVNPRYPDAPAVPRTVLINPVVTPIGDEEEEGWEGCLSVPGPARRGAALRPHPLHRLRPLRRSRSTAPSAASMRAWCSTRSITCWASSIRCGCAISRASATPRSCFRASMRPKTSSPDDQL